MEADACDDCCGANAAGSPVLTGAEPPLKVSWWMRVGKLNPLSVI
jgi:hypothetical protein